MELHPLPLLYDALIEEDQLRFVLLRGLTVARVKCDNIERIDEIGVVSIGAFTAFNFKNRFMGRTFMIRFKRGWFARLVLITPKDPERFVAWAREHGVPMSAKS